MLPRLPFLHQRNRMFRNHRFAGLGLALVLFGSALPVIAQNGTSPSTKRAVTVEDIYRDYKFYGRPTADLQWMADDNFYSDLTEEGLVKFSVATGQKVETLVPASALRDVNSRPLQVRGYTFAKQGSSILFFVGTVGHYRHSASHICYVWDGAKLSVVANGALLREPALSPDGSKLGYVKANNLYFSDLKRGEEVQVTTDGKENQIINGHTDWVYEEEFGFPEGFYWSPDSKRLAYYRFDESRVPLFTMDIYGPLYPKRHEFKYPKAGETNSQVTIHIYDLDGKQTRRVETGDPAADQYIPKVQWTDNPSQLVVIRANRHHNKVEFLLADATSGSTRTLFTEESQTWIDTDDLLLRFLPGGQELLWASDRDGFRHLYLYQLDGKAPRQVTKGNWDVTDYYGYDAKTKTLYYQSTEGGSTRRHVYSQSLDGKKKKNLTEASGLTWNNASFSSGLRYYILRASAEGVPSITSLHDNTGKQLRVYEDNQALKQRLADYKLSPRRFATLKAANGQELNSYTILPPDFDSTKKYPVFMFVYGGPGSQQVTENWGGAYYFLFNVLASKGYIVACVDNRGTGGRGRDFKKSTYLNLGKLETEDQIASAQALAKLPYVDAGRIGIFGWSYGGYMTLLAMTKGADVFKAGVAVAPVTNWRYYDTIYTERFLRTPQENPKGYDENSPINFTNQVKGKLLLMHGTGDDNVHYQNSIEFVNAMIKSNKQFQTFFYPNRAHGISGGNAQYHLFTQLVTFVEGNL